MDPDAVFLTIKPLPEQMKSYPKYAHRVKIHVCVVVLSIYVCVCVYIYIITGGEGEEKLFVFDKLIKIKADTLHTC